MKAHLNLNQCLLEQRDEVLHGLQQLLRLGDVMHLHEEEAQLLQLAQHSLILCLYRACVFSLQHEDQHKQLAGCIRLVDQTYIPYNYIYKTDTCTFKQLDSYWDGVSARLGS